MSGRGAARRTRPATAALALVTGIGPFATDTYLAALPDLRQSLQSSATTAQLTLTAFIAGMAVGQLVLGAVSDATGRRKLLLIGALLFTALTAVCAIAPNGAVLVAARLVAGIAAGGGVVIGRAVVTDAHEGTAAAAMFGTLASISFLGPIVAPVLGGAILGVGTWRTVFAVLTALGAVMVVAVLVGIPETLPPERRHPPGLRQYGARMADLARDWGFMRHVAVYCLSAAGFFTYIGGSAFVLRSAFDVGPGLYSVVFASNAAAMALTGVLFRVLVGRVGAEPLRAVGVTSGALASVGLLATALFAPGAPVAVPWVLLCVVVGGTGLTVPATTVLAQQAGRRAAGTAASLQGGCGFLVGAAMTPLTGVLGSGSLLPMAAAMAIFYAAALVLLRVVSRHSERTGAPTP
ncbi:multidrug effflux MFS transporter [Actinokineospora sp. NBRC 105648]|uniref:multidrug effflux MFS transporter n=1 Tax=Actinokineospora sp. NBRC 105648 TaxID=3032206 RepID=UPI0024A4E4EB|nr:multidrug effflux MFS transporter [Actinokineospora sp. NBRC 105648]GLZ38116.1 Bcr/CflA family drug resistance efflux transporter [Actinokineospora sp. NBRC 105648]